MSDLRKGNIFRKEKVQTAGFSTAGRYSSTKFILCFACLRCALFLPARANTPSRLLCEVLTLLVRRPASRKSCTFLSKKTKFWTWWSDKERLYSTVRPRPCFFVHFFVKEHAYSLCCCPYLRASSQKLSKKVLSGQTLVDL